MELDSIPGLLSRQPSYGEGDFKPPRPKGRAGLFLAGFACGAALYAAGTSMLPPDACGWASALRAERGYGQSNPGAMSMLPPLASPAVGPVSADPASSIEPGPGINTTATRQCHLSPTTRPGQGRGCDNLSHRKSRLKSSKIEIGRFHQLLNHLTRENRT